MLFVLSVGRVFVQPGTESEPETGIIWKLYTNRSTRSMAASQHDPHHTDGTARAPAEPVVEIVSPSRIESLKLPPRPGMHLGLDDRRGILDSPVLLPLLTVRQESCCSPVAGRSWLAFSVCHSPCRKSRRRRLEFPFQHSQPLLD